MTTLTNKQIMVASHKLAKELVETTENYMIALKFAMKKVWSAAKRGTKRIVKGTITKFAKEIKGIDSRVSKFDNFRFEGLKPHFISNKYLSMNRVSENGNKIVVKVSDNHLIATKFGYALILDQTRVVFLKDWQVSQNFYGNEVVLDRNYFNVKEWGNHSEFLASDENLNFENWLNAAQEQQLANNKVKFN